MSSWNFFIRALLRHKLIVAGWILSSMIAAGAFFIAGPRQFSAESVLLLTQGAADRSDPSRNLGQEVASLSRIALTDELFSRAVSNVGIERFELNRRADATRQMRILIGMLRNQTSVRGDIKSNVIEISFRYGDPVLAADFVNALADALIAKQFDLSRGVDSVSFVQEQKDKLDKEARDSALAMAEFGRTTSIYSLSDQRQFLLKRASEVEASLTQARGSVAKSEAIKASLTEQLLKLKQVTSSPFVSNLVNSLGSPDKAKSGDRGGDSKSDTPPLLMVRVYQDAMVELLKVNNDFAGFKALEQSLSSELSKVRAELGALSEHQARYEEIQRSLSLSSASAEAYGKKMIEEKIAQDVSKAQLSQVRLLQSAIPNSIPVAPSLSLYLILAAAFAFFASAASCYLFERYNSGAAPLRADATRTNTAVGFFSPPS